MTIIEAKEVLKEFKEEKIIGGEKVNCYFIPINIASESDSISEAIIRLCADDMEDESQMGEYMLSVKNSNYVLWNPNIVLRDLGKVVDNFSLRLNEIKALSIGCRDVFEVNEETGELLPWLSLDKYYSNVNNCQTKLDKVLAESCKAAYQFGYILVCTFSEDWVIYYYFKCR